MSSTRTQQRSQNEADTQLRSHPTCQFRADQRWLDPQTHQDRSIKKPNEIENEMSDPPNDINHDLLDRIQGSMVGMALGDALGAHVEFRPRQFLVDKPVTDLKGGGTWGLKKGQFTDDTSMALCLAASLVARRDYVPYDQLVRYKWWYRNGYMSSTGRCFDIGAATSQSLREFERRQIGFANKHGIPPEQMDFLSRPDLLKEFDVFCSVEGVAGNGALMRLAPVPLFFHQHPIEAVEFSGLSGSITHGDRKAFDACRYYGALIVAALRGEEKEQLLGKDFYSKHRQWFNGDPLHPDIMKIAEGSYQRGGYDKGIRGRGYIVSALEAALWAFWSDKGSFEKGVLAAVNLGDDTDTTAAIYGQLAGAHYGYKILPEKWLGDVYAKSFILCLSKWIAYEGQRWQPDGSSPQRPRCNTDPDAASAFGSGSNEQFPANHSKSAPSEMPTSSPQTAYHDENLKSCDDVCRWIQKLGEIGAKYLDVFHNHYVDGYWLLNHVDDKLLKKYGIDSADHRRVIINGIEQLKKNAQCNPTPAEKSKP